MVQSIEYGRQGMMVHPVVLRAWFDEVSIGSER